MTLDRLTTMRHFVVVVEAGSFSNAAKRLGVANATITQSVKNLEAHLGVRLLNRTTRQMKLTWEGSVYLERCRALLEELESIEQDVVRSAKDPSGELRVEIPSAIGHAFIVPKMLEFSRQNPNLYTTVFLNPGASSLVEDGIDVAVQLGDLEPSSLIARKIHTVRHIACAAPGLLEKHGVPQHPDDLSKYPCLSFFSPHTTKPLKWVFEREENKIVVAPRGPLRFNSSEALIDGALAEGGIIYMLDLLVAKHLKSGALVPILTDWETRERGVYIVCPVRQNLPQKVRTFTAFIEKVLADI